MKQSIRQAGSVRGGAARTSSMRSAVAVLLTGGLVLAVLPPSASAQGGSSLFVVGDAGAKPSGKSSAKAAVKAEVRKAEVRKADVRKPEVKLTSTATKAAPEKNASRAAVRPRAKKGTTVARTPSGPVALNGRWHDGECIPLTGVTHQPPLFVKRQYVFDDQRKSWQLDAAVYSSDSCVGNTRMLSYRGEGSFAVTGASRVAANAYEASFKVDRWQATPITREGVLTLLNGRCGSGDFEEARPLDLSVTGCGTLGIRSIVQRPREFELVRISDGKFYLGTRSFMPGLSDDRPTQISSYGMSRISQ